MLPGETHFERSTLSFKARETARNHRLKAGRNDRREEGAELTCECGDLRCNARIALTATERNDRRSRPTRYWVKPGHVSITIERMIEENDRYAIVEGDGRAVLVVASER